MAMEFPFPVTRFAASAQHMADLGCALIKAAQAVAAEPVMLDLDLEEVRESATPAPQAEFICNMPADSVDDVLASLAPGCTPRICVTPAATWVRCGSNLLGPPYGKHANPADIGVYRDPARP